MSSPPRRAGAAAQRGAAIAAASRAAVDAERTPATQTSRDGTGVTSRRGDGGSMDELRALSQRLQARNAGGRPGDSVIYGLSPRTTKHTDGESSDEGGSPSSSHVVGEATEVAASPPPLPGAGGRTPAGGQTRSRTMGSEHEQAAGVGARLSVRRSNSPPSPEPAAVQRDRSPQRGLESDSLRASKPLASALGTSLSNLLREAILPIQQTQQAMQTQLDELQVALKDRITPLEARQDEFATVLDLLVSRAEGFERKLQAGSDSLAEHIAGSQEALSSLEGALFDKLDASREEFFSSQDVLAEERSSEIELINGALATIEERLQADVKAREEEVGLVNAALQSLESQLEGTVGSGLSKLKTDFEEQLSLLADTHATHAAEHRTALQDLAGKHSESTEQHRQELEKQVAELHAKHETLHASHSESAELHRQELERQVAELHAKHDALQASHTESAMQHQESVEEKLTALSEKHTIAAEQQTAVLAEQLRALAAKHKETLEEQRNMQVQQRRRRCDVAHQRANCRMELVYAGWAFTPWLAAARALQEEKQRVYHQELRVQDEELRTQLEALSVAHNQSTKDHRSEVENRIKALSDKHEQTSYEHKAELRLQLDALSKDHSAMSEQYRESLEAQLKVLAAEHENAATEHKQSLEAHRAEAAEKTGLIDDAMSELEAQMARGKEQKDREIASLHAQLVSRIEALQNSQHQSSVDQKAQIEAIAASHSESTEQHRQELETQIAELHTKHETLHASHSESAELHRQELERQVAELHAKHDALHEKHNLTVEEQRSGVEEQLAALAKEHAAQLEEHESTAQKQLEYHLTEHSEQTAQQKRALELKLMELSNQHEQALAMQRAELAEKRQRRIETSGQRAVHRMENNVVCRAFGPWLAAARDQVRASSQEKLKSVAESADAAVIGMTRAANELEAVQSTLQASETAKSDLVSELALHRQTLEEQIEALTTKHGKELSGLRMDALDRSKSISDASRAVQEVLMEMQTVREDCTAIERRLTEEFVSVQVTCDRLARVAADDTLKKALDEEVENRRQDVDMCNEAILALAEQLATGPPEVLRPTGSSDAGDIGGDFRMWRAGVSEDISTLESRMRQELIAVQVRCDRLAREVQRIGGEDHSVGAVDVSGSSLLFSTPAK